jgi:hypothetical protein
MSSESNLMRGRNSLTAEGRLEKECFQTSAEKDKESTDLTSVGKVFGMDFGSSNTETTAGNKQFVAPHIY